MPIEFVIESVIWSILSKPAGSGASINSASGMTNWAKFKADSTGTYNIKVSMVANSITKDTTMNIYDISGRLVKQLANQQMSPGKYTVTFDSKEFNLSSGVYFYRITAGKDFVMTKKMILVK